MANAEALMRLFNAGNHQRKVGGTKMNAESSRSHSVFSILLEVFMRHPNEGRTQRDFYAMKLEAALSCPLDRSLWSSVVPKHVQEFDKRRNQCNV